MRRVQGAWVALCTLLVLWGCQVPEEKDEQDAVTDFRIDVTDPACQQILNLGDKQNLDSLEYFAESSDPMQRYLVARSLQSYSPTAAIPILDSLIEDPYIPMRTQAAYALGQTGKQRAVASLLKAYESSDSLRQFSDLNATILEAVGKCGDENTMKFISTMKGISERDTTLLLGQSRSLYQFALRGLTCDEGLQRMVSIATGPQYAQKARLVAAHYLRRARSHDLTSYSDDLLPTTLNHPNPEIRLALARAISRINTDNAEIISTKIVESEKDYRVLVSLIRGWNDKKVRYSDHLASQLIDHPNVHVAMTTMDYYLANGSPRIAKQLFTRYLNEEELHLKYKAAAVANKWLSWRNTIERDRLNGELRQELKESKDPYIKKEILQALAHDVQNQGYLEGYVRRTPSGQLKSAGIAALATLYTSEKFKKYYGNQFKSKIRAAKSFIDGQMKDADPGAIYEAVTILRTPQLDLLAGTSSEPYEKLQAKLNLPAEIEAYNALEQLIAEINDTEYKAHTPDINHPIDWSYLSSPDSIYAQINTDIGTIIVKLYAEHAPGSVSNFLSLSSSGFYKNNALHRVVPNFVIQDGCPRGDGYGSLDYTIRSELGPKYYEKAGLLGMASAGRHTEGTQWFITHRATPHLSGKYTIFGEVVEGMDVVHRLQEGTKIKNIKQI